MQHKVLPTNKKICSKYHLGSRLGKFLCNNLSERGPYKMGLEKFSKINKRGDGNRAPKGNNVLNVGLARLPCNSRAEAVGAYEIEQHNTNIQST